jgi:hypothetical protein
LTKKGIQASTDAKVKEIKTLLEKLQVTLSAEEVVTENGIIRKVIYYLDTEPYEITNEQTVDAVVESTPSESAQ